MNYKEFMEHISKLDDFGIDQEVFKYSYTLEVLLNLSEEEINDRYNLEFLDSEKDPAKLREKQIIVLALMYKDIPVNN